MNKTLLLAAAALFSVGSAFAGCGSCCKAPAPHNYCPTSFFAFSPCSACGCCKAEVKPACPAPCAVAKPCGCN